MRKIFALCILISFLFCTHKNTEKKTQQLNNKLSKDIVQLKGTYIWDFDLMGGKQVSKHIFYPDSITYSMKGKVYSTDYTMRKLSFDKQLNKWIGEDQNKVVYVLFFKDKTDSTISIYKHKCKKNGLQEALDFSTPDAKSTEDHGWNIYSLIGHEHKNVFPIAGTFTNNKSQIIFKDHEIVLDQKAIQKISFHSGERRWVGKYKNQYVQIFFQHLDKESKNIEISLRWSKNLKELYETKFSSIKNWQKYVQQ